MSAEQLGFTIDRNNSFQPQEPTMPIQETTIPSVVHSIQEVPIVDRLPRDFRPRTGGIRPTPEWTFVIGGPPRSNVRLK